MCGLGRVIFPAAMIGLAVSSLVSHPVAGWLAAAAVASIVYALGRRSTMRSCAVTADVEPVLARELVTLDRTGVLTPPAATFVSLAYDNRKAATCSTAQLGPAVTEDATHSRRSPFGGIIQPSRAERL